MYFCEILVDAVRCGCKNCGPCPPLTITDSNCIIAVSTCIELMLLTAIFVDKNVANSSIFRRFQTRCRSCSERVCQNFSGVAKDLTLEWCCGTNKSSSQVNPLAPHPSHSCSKRFLVCQWISPLHHVIVCEKLDTRRVEFNSYHKTSLEFRRALTKCCRLIIVSTSNTNNTFMFTTKFTCTSTQSTKIKAIS